jgi:hypothetical protein
LCQNFQTIHAWQHDVQYDQVRLDRAGSFQPSEAVDGEKDLVALFAKV